MSNFRTEEFSNKSPYQVMFGPDKCGLINKIHFIIRRKNLITGKYEEKHLTNPPPARLNRSTNLYTLVIKRNQDFEIRVNGKIIRAGNLLDEHSMNPSINPPKEIDDENDTKPENWIDEITIPDPEQLTKPNDWDESGSAQVPDPNAVKPDNWREDMAEYISDPDAEIPEDWDVDEDGEYIAPDIPNPECEFHGCGPWTAPLVRNPNYKGRWIQPKIPNPDYKGPWSPRKLPNPDYYEDTTPSDLEPIAAIGIELWTMQNDILFDNFYLGHSIQEAEEIGNATFALKNALEKVQEEKENEKMELKRRKFYRTWLDHFRNDPLDFLVEFSRLFINNLNENSILFILNQPFVFFTMIAIFAISFTILFGIITIFYAFFKASSSKKSKKEDALIKDGVSSAKEKITYPTKRIKIVK